MSKVLIDGATATDATKIEFNLQPRDFEYGCKPALRSRGLGAGDVVKIYEVVNGGYQDTGTTLDNTTSSVAIQSLGGYAVDITMTTGGPASVELQRSRTE